MAALDDSIREVSALGKASRAALSTDRGAPADARADVSTLAPGVRVLDLVTGEIGVIQSVAIQQITLSAT